MKNRAVPIFDLVACRATLKARQAQQYRAREARRQAALAAMRAAVDQVLPHFPAVQRAYLFGSVVRGGGLRSTSDIDLAVEGRLDAESYFAVWRELERAAPGWEIEVVELGPEVPFAARVREQGEVIYERPAALVESGSGRRPGSDR